VQRLPVDVQRQFKEMGIHLDLMDSINASATFNVLNEVYTYIHLHQPSWSHACISAPIFQTAMKVIAIYILICAFWSCFLRWRGQEGRVVLAALLPLGRNEDEAVKQVEEEDILKDMPRPQMTYPEP
jgi:hypothetical protein